MTTKTKKKNEVIEACQADLNRATLANIESSLRYAAKVALSVMSTTELDRYEISKLCCEKEGVTLATSGYDHYSVKSDDGGLYFHPRLARALGVLAAQKSPVIKISKRGSSLTYSLCVKKADAIKQLDALNEKNTLVPRYAHPEKLVTAFTLNNNHQIVSQGIAEIVKKVKKAKTTKAKTKATKQAS